jgi:diacylglycerol kinase family enzyme
VPAGTRNHFALDLGVDRDDVVGSRDAYGAARQARIDLADVNVRVFVNNVSLGVYARIVASDEYRDAKLRTAAKMLPTLLGRVGLFRISVQSTTRSRLSSVTALFRSARSWATVVRSRSPRTDRQ